ncbi:hypothetical protein D021_1016A, partial [Vibrio parahaemolyticus 10296]
MYGFSAFA